MNKMLDAIEQSAKILRAQRLTPGTLHVSKSTYDKLVDCIMDRNPYAITFPLRWEGVLIEVSSNGR